MRKAILSPICSALIIPGFGQIINKNTKKGLVLLGIVFLLLVSVIIKLVQMVFSVFDKIGTEMPDSFTILEKLRSEDNSLIQLILILFGIVWLYSIIDATLEGIKTDKKEKT